MLLPEVAHAPNLDLAIFHSIFYSPPTLQPIPLPTIRTMQQKEIDVSKSTLLHTLRNTLSRSIVIRITRQFRRVMYIFPLHLWMRFEVLQNRLPDLPLVVLHLR